MTVLPRFEGGRRLAPLLAAAGGAALLATGLGALQDAREALFGYLFAYVYWLGLCLGALLLLATLHATGARWSVVLRRTLEVMAATCPIFVLLFLPIAAGMDRLFVWVSPPPELGEEALALLAHKRPYLNVPFFLVRAALYFGAWCAVALLLYRWSVRQDEAVQDEAGEARLWVRQRRLATGALPVLGLTLSFAATDWLMSLEPLWQSSIYGIYIFAGAFAGAIALLALVGAVWREPAALGGLLGPGHFQRLGTLLFAFVCFWAYVAFSQYLLIWIASLPHEVPWYLVRLSDGWRTVAVLVALLHFVLPFFVLLSRKVKRRREALAAVALVVLAAHALDTYWLILPALHPDAPAPHWTSLTAFVGIGAVAVATALWRARGHYLVPVRDPFLVDSLRGPRP